MPNACVIASGLEFPEGPVAMPDGSVVLVEIRGRRLTRVWPDGAKEVVAEIPGGDKKDEVVMLGAHLDSWHAGTGATDNGAKFRPRLHRSISQFGGFLQQYSSQSNGSADFHGKQP